jgi:hypothetical protein
MTNKAPEFLDLLMHAALLLSACNSNLCCSGAYVPGAKTQSPLALFAAFATLSFYPDNDLLDKLGHHAAGIISTFRPQATSNTLWAYAKLGYTPCEALLRAAAAQMTIDLTKCVPQDISNG